MSEALHPQIQRCYDLALNGAWRHPFFLIPLGHVEWHEASKDSKVKTMALVSRIVGKGGDAAPQINLYINTEWTQSLPDKQIFGVLCHEIMHSLLHHHQRSGGRNLETWAQATDMAINASLTQSGIELPSYALKAPHGHEEDAAEELYTYLVEGEIEKPKGYDPEKVGAGCQPEKHDPNSQEPGQGDDGDDSDEKGDGQGPPSEGDEEGEGDGQGEGGSSDDAGDQNNDRVWGEMLAQCQNAARGSAAAKVMAKIFAPKPSKLKWDRLLKSAASRANARSGRDSQTYKRVSRRSEEIILPGWESKRPAIGVIIDSSGSVSDEMLASAINSAKEAAKVSGVRVFLVLHAEDVYFADWVKPEVSVASLSALCTNRGGTCADPAFKAMAEAPGKFDSLIYMTDGEVGTYPDKPDNVRNVIVGIVGNRKSDYRAQVPDAWRELLVDVDV